MNVSLLAWQSVQGVSLPSAKCMLGLALAPVDPE